MKAFGLAVICTCLVASPRLVWAQEPTPPAQADEPTDQPAPAPTAPEAPAPAPALAPPAAAFPGVAPPRSMAPADRTALLVHLDDQIEDAKSTRTIGMVVALLGVAAMAAGAGLMPEAHEQHANTGLQGASWAMFIAGAGSMGVGLPFWVLGQKRVNRCQDQKAQLLFSFSAGREQAGAQIGLAF